MKPAFALSLSFEGISLLHRAAGGWRRVGDVALDVPDLAAALADLRAKALLLEPDGLACKLIIPNDQIRYLTLETGRAEGAARQARVREALDGATPYAVDELAFDISIEGTLTHVAAVARETLAEAETFATDHRFNPVSFVAIPGDQPFLGEPFFGAAGTAAGAEVEPDGIAVVVTGPAVFPEPTGTEPAADADPHPGQAVPATEAPEAETEAAPETASEDTAEPLPAAIGFSSRRGKDAGGAPSLAGARRDDGTDSTAAAKPVAAPAAKAAAPEAPAAAKTPKTPKAGKAPKAAAPKAKAPNKPARGGAFRDRAAGLLGRRPSAASGAKPAEPQPTPARRAKPTAHPITQPPAAQSFASTRPEPPQDETERMTVFGARQTQREGGRPRRLGLILTVILLLLLAAVAGWAALFSGGGVARLFSAPGERPQIAADPSPAPSPAEDSPTQTEAGAPATGPAPAQPPLTSALTPTPPAAPDSPPTTTASDTAASEPPLPEQAPQLPALADTLSDTDSAVLDALRGDPGSEQPAPPEQQDIAALDPELAAEPEPEATTAPQATADSDTLYAATGIWPDAPEPPETPAIIGLDDLYVASIDRTDLSQDAVALPPARAFATDAALGALTSPAAAGTAFALDDRGLVTPTPEGSTTPDGITVYLGRPPVVPPPTPTRTTPADEARAEAEALRQHLAGFRPRPRPGDLVEQSERAQLGGRSRQELGRLRPRTRPASAQQDAAADAAASDAEAADAAATATAQAVASALIPKSRPGDFQDRVRNSARASIGIPQNLAASPTAAPAPATVSPSIPSSASVARQATLKNEINLRKVNLIGVYGTASNRRALVRLPSGRYKKVKVGDSIDGGKVVAIGDNQLQYQKGGRNHTLKMPSS